MYRIVFSSDSKAYASRYDIENLDGSDFLEDVAYHTEYKGNAVLFVNDLSDLQDTLEREYHLELLDE
mgnify:CR=1 FL=1